MKQRNLYILAVIIITFVLLLLYTFHGGPFDVTDDFAVSPSFAKRLSVLQRDPVYGSIHYTDMITSQLSNVGNDELENIRCGDSFIRTEQGVYILENEKINHKNIRRIKNDRFIRFMREKERTIPQGKKILTGKVCETDNTMQILFYSVGSYDNKAVDTTNIRKAILYSTDNVAYIEVFTQDFISKSRSFAIANSKSHIRCDKPFQLSKDSVLTVMCSEEADWVTTFTVYELQVRTGSRSILGACRNTFENFMNQLTESDCST